ncbi:hypothetical protein P0082_02390 [Candidatus Haliotispira prima]|uniref:TP-1001-like C-terminal domain-containing protein n=1 Tax=Candidatus Haliotispira prima TaxID=3034016 RepID=A0ABY8MI81_9SPIO|nr:hypothetical protein P0082_02390 [Candidatus Haliotispira prima]
MRSRSRRKSGWLAVIIPRVIPWVLLLSWSCSLDRAIDGLGLMERDIHPPVLLEQQGFEDYFSFRFDEPIHSGGFSQIQPELPFDSADISGTALEIRLGQKTVPGRSYLLRAWVADAENNTLHFLVRVYGKNLYPARLLINELNPEGSKSSNSPEVIEFYAEEGGNIGGLMFAVGTKEENKGSFIFPPLDIAAGDFILLHTRWDPSHKYDIERVDETDSKARARARLSSNQAWDFWADEISGLSDTNGALALYQSPQGALMDAVIYSTSVTAERYRGWKTSYLERQVDILADLGGWLGSGSSLVPEDAIRSKDSTGTRSLSRLHVDGKPVDTNSAADWIIVPTRGYSFGAPNILERYSK